MFRGYRREWLVGDILAGVTVAAIAIPESLGYASIVGLPVQTGLYTGLLPAIVFAFIASSRQLVVGADSATATLVAAGAGMVVASSQPGYASAVAVVTILAGVILALSAVLRLGFLADLISAPVLAGFLTGVGVSLIIGKLPDMLGLSVSGTTWDKLVGTVKDVDQTNWTAAALSAGVVAIMLVGERINKRLPAALAALVVMSVVAVLIDAPAKGVKVVGDIPPGLPVLTVPSFTAAEIGTLVSTAFAIAVVVLAQSAAVARSFGSKNNYRVNENRDLLALGVGNVASGFTGGFAVNGSPPRTTAGDAAGSRSQMVNIVMALVIGLILLFATGLFEYIPSAVLDAVVFAIGIGLLKVAALRSVASYRRSEFLTAILCAVVVAFVGVQEGVLLAVVVSLIDRLRRQYNPVDEVLASPPDHAEPRLVMRLGERTMPEDVLVFRYGTSLFFENAANFDDRVSQLVRASPVPVRLVVLDMAAMSDLDYTGVETLQRLARHLKSRGTTTVVTEMAATVAFVVAKSGLKSDVAVVPRLEDAVMSDASARGAGVAHE